MPMFDVEIIETLARIETIKAESADDAEVIIENRYWAEDIVLDSMDFLDVEFVAKEVDDDQI